MATFLLPWPASLVSQQWNNARTLALVRQATERRTKQLADSGLVDYRATAHGYLTFLAQLGEGFREPPQVVKADELALEVYWRAPNLSKQFIVGRRDTTLLPTDIAYHRDHLGIVQNNFGSAIRLGEGDEVRDVPHPLGPSGPDVYDVSLGDTTTIVLPQRAVRVAALRVRPKNFSTAAIVGTLFVDLETADLVRMAFNFTPRAYLDPQLEDVSVVLDNALWEGRFWLPYRQEIEIRRRATWLDIPARGIIRGRWEIDNYLFNVGLAASWFRGEEITAVPKAERDSFPWPVPLTTAIQNIADPVRENDLEEVRAEVSRIAGRRVLTGLKRQRLGARRLSDLIRFNRVEGLAAGAGFVWRTPGDDFEVRALGSYGFSDGAGKGGVSITSADGLALTVYRQVRDIADQAVIAPLVNSVSAQEFGDDYGDYYRATGWQLSARFDVGGRTEWLVAVKREHVQSLPIRATPASGQFRPNPAITDGDHNVGSLTLRRRSEGFAVRRDIAGEVSAEIGSAYVRFSGTGHLLVPLGAGSTRLLTRVQFGVGGDELPPHRGFVMGGRATLLGDEFREWGGRRAALVHLELRTVVPFFRLPAGPARTPGSITLAPYIALGSTDEPFPQMPWKTTPGTRVTLGLGAEWLGLFRIEAGYGMQSRQVRVAFDVTRDFWDIL